MSIIFAGGELSSFTRFNAVESQLNGSYHLPARCGIHLMKNGFIRSAVLGGRSDLWFHFDLYQQFVNGAFAIFEVASSANTSLFRIGSNGQVTVGNTVVGSANIFNQGIYTYDIHLRGGASGLVEIFVDKELVFASAGNYPLNDMSSMTFGTTGVDLVNSSANSTNTIVSQVIVADESTIGHKLATLAIVADGSQAQWVGGVSDVDEIILDTEDYISAANAGLIHTWSMIPLPNNVTNVKALVVSALARFGNSGPKNLDAICRIGGTNYAVPMTQLGSGFTPSLGIFHLNPVSSTPWQPVVVDALELGIRSRF